MNFQNVQANFLFQTAPPCVSDQPTCQASCRPGSALCLTPCLPARRQSSPQGVLFCQRVCSFNSSNDYCSGECVLPPSECEPPPQTHIPFDQIPAARTQQAVYIPKIYSDPIVKIIRQAGIPTFVL